MTQTSFFIFLLLLLLLVIAMYFFFCTIVCRSWLDRMLHWPVPLRIFPHTHTNTSSKRNTNRRARYAYKPYEMSIKSCFIVEWAPKIMRYGRAPAENATSSSNRQLYYPLSYCIEHQNIMVNGVLSIWHESHLTRKSIRFVFRFYFSIVKSEWEHSRRFRPNGGKR